jgi:hypothetical protein
VRRFTKDDIKSAIERVDAVADLGEDVWIQDKDHNSSRYYARVAGGKLFANTAASDGSSIPWKSLKAAVKAVT